MGISSQMIVGIDRVDSAVLVSLDPIQPDELERNGSSFLSAPFYRLSSFTERRKTTFPLSIGH